MGIRAYARTKRIQVVVAEKLAQRYMTDGITVHSMHPGWADTSGITDSMPRFAKVISPILRSPSDGADTIVWLTAADAATERSGEFWCDRRMRPTYYLSWQADDPAARRNVWSHACRAVKIEPT
ncbi:hypothetical protein [Aeromicrobium sp.]|uniref:hypothetical protein n=1 Tax=Aeromicrobium sp. TaxID=1871063 RepID=UPI0030BAD4CB